MELQGIVEAVKMNDVNTRNGVKQSYNILIDGSWLNSFKKYDAKKGDSVVVEYTENGQYKNIKNITIAQQTTAPVTQSQAPVQSLIVRQNALGHATNIVLSQNTTASNDQIAGEVIRIATILENWVIG